MPDEINGLPTHVLLVHGVVVLLPLCAVLLVAAAAFPSVRARLGLALPVLAVGCAVLVPLTTNAGEDLRRTIGGGGDLVERHAELGEGVLMWAIAVMLLSFLVWWLSRREGEEAVTSAGERVRSVRTSSAGRIETALALRVVLVVLCGAVATGTVIQVVRTGESGSKAVWNGVGEG